MNDTGQDDTSITQAGNPHRRLVDRERKVLYQVKGVLDLNPFGMPLSLPPTGKSFKLPKCVFTFRVVGDKVTYYSEEGGKGGGLAGILEQIGVNH